MSKLLVAIVAVFAAAEFARAAEERPINFANQIVPIFTKAGCNAGGCHGKSSGQNGFKLSLLGFEPSEDYEHLTREAKGRRIFPAAPERSLLLLKATGELPHGGGKRLEKGSRDYQLLLRWISSGTPYGNPSDPYVVGIEVSPKEKTMAVTRRRASVAVAAAAGHRGGCRSVNAGAVSPAVKEGPDDLVPTRQLLCGW